MSLDDNNRVPADITSEEVREVIRKTKKLIRPGLDKLRYEHLVTLVGRGTEPLPEEEAFCGWLAQVLTIIMKGDEPEEVTAALREMN